MFRCTYCNKTRFTKYLIVDGHSLLTCNSCGLLLTEASEGEIRDYVTAKYNEQYTINYKQAVLKLNKRFERQLLLITSLILKGRLLDIGCGTGFFLKFLKDKGTKFSLFGIEPNKILRKSASDNTGILIKDGLLKKIPYPIKYFDIVTCYDVLEHNIELHKNLKEIRRVLKTNGLIFVQAPNYKSFMAYITGKRWDWWCIPDHVLHFSYDFLTTYLKENGFRILKSYTYEDQEDFLSNIKGLFSKNYLTKICFFLLIPLLLIIERIGWLTNRGGLTVVLAQKI